MNINMPENPQFNKYYRKHLKLLKLNGLQPKTIEAYSRAIRRIGNYFDCRIDNLTSDQLLDYFNELLDSHSWSAVKLDLYGLKFFYSRVLNKTWEDIPLIKPPKTSRIPDILSIDQVCTTQGSGLHSSQYTEKTVKNEDLPPLLSSQTHGQGGVRAVQQGNHREATLNLPQKAYICNIFLKPDKNRPLELIFCFQRAAY